MFSSGSSVTTRVMLLVVLFEQVVIHVCQSARRGLEGSSLSLWPLSSSGSCSSRFWVLPRRRTLQHGSTPWHWQCGSTQLPTSLEDIWTRQWRRAWQCVASFQFFTPWCMWSCRSGRREILADYSEGWVLVMLNRFCMTLASLGVSTSSITSHVQLSLFFFSEKVVGAMLGSVVTAFLVPGASLQMGDGGPGCFDRSVIPAGVTDQQVSWIFSVGNWWKGAVSVFFWWKGWWSSCRSLSGSSWRLFLDQFFRGSMVGMHHDFHLDLLCLCLRRGQAWSWQPHSLGSWLGSFLLCRLRGSVHGRSTEPCKSAGTFDRVWLWGRYCFWAKHGNETLEKGKEVTSEVDQTLMNILHPSVGSFLRSPIFPSCACNTSLSRYCDTVSSFEEA